MRLWRSFKQPSWQQTADQPTERTETYTTHVHKRQVRQYGQEVGTGAAPLETLEGETLLLQEM